MKTRMLTSLFIVLALVVPRLVSAQTTVSTTTLGAASSLNGDVLVVASTTNMSAPSATGGGTFGFVDLEQFRVIRVISSTQIQVQRGVAGFPSVHRSGATVYFGSGDAFKNVDPPIGTCTPGNWAYTPWINVSNGNMSVCQYRDSATRYVITTNARSITFNSSPQACGSGTSCE